MTQRLVSNIEGYYAFRDPRVREAFLTIDRAIFVEPYDSISRSFFQTDDPYEDVAWPVKATPEGHPISSSTQPSLMAIMIDLLEIPDGGSVLEIGAATGYNAAIMSRVAGPAGSITSIDIEPDVMEHARTALERSATIAPVRLLLHDAAEGAPEHAPYDRLICTAAAAVIPETWTDQLAPGGRMVIPLVLRGMGFLVMLEKDRSGTLRGSVEQPCGFMPIRGELFRPEQMQVNITGLADSLATMEQTPLPEEMRDNLAAQMRCALRIATVHPGFRVLMDTTPSQRPDYSRVIAHGIYHGPDRFAAYQRGSIYGTDKATLDELAGLIEEWRALGSPGAKSWEITVRYGNESDGDEDGVSTIVTRLEPRMMRMGFRLKS